jgi:hypothetical protein
LPYDVNEAEHAMDRDKYPDSYAVGYYAVLLIAEREDGSSDYLLTKPMMLYEKNYSMNNE